MRLAAFTDYGLRVLMRLAGTPGEPLTTAGVAEEFQIPYNHLTKVVLDLSRGGFVTTQRGAGGGIRLARPANAITLGEVVRHLESRYDMVECFRADGGACLLNPLCRLKPQLAAARLHRPPDQVARHYEHFLVRDRDRAPRLERIQRRHQPGCPGGAHEGNIDLRSNRHLLDRQISRARCCHGVCQARRLSFGGDVLRAELDDLLREQVRVPPRRERNHFEALRQLADDVERLAADRTGGAEDGNAAGVAHLSIVRLHTRPGQRVLIGQRKAGMTWSVQARIASQSLGGRRAMLTRAAPTSR